MKSKGREKRADRWMRSDGRECKKMNEEQYGDSQHQNGHEEPGRKGSVLWEWGRDVKPRLSHQSLCAVS